MSKVAETELTLYAKLTRPAGLDQAVRIEEHEQWEKGISDTARMRIRKTTFLNAAGYEQTIKAKASEGENVHANHETTVDISPEFFVEWRTHIAEKGSLKRRHVFVMKNCSAVISGETIELPDQTIEIDLLYLPNGSLSDWVKIDIELDDLLKHLKEVPQDVSKLALTVSLTSLPIGLEDIIDSSDEKNKELVAKFWEIHNLNPKEFVDGGKQ